MICSKFKFFLCSHFKISTTMLERNLFAVFCTVFCLLTRDISACIEGVPALSEERKIVGDSLYKECYCIGNDNEIVRPKWLGPGDVEIRPGSNSGIETEERANLLSLYIKKLSLTMAGTYKCLCECGGKSNTLEQLGLIVYNPLEIVNTPEEQDIVLGANSEIKCEGWGGSGERYTWWEKPTNKEKNKYNEVKDGLIVNNVTTEDRGTFVCFVSDMETGSEVNRSINVKVISKPKVLNIYANPHTAVVAGETLTLECETEGTPLPEYSWQINEPVTSSAKKHKISENVTYEHNRLIFENITAEDQGTYECTASNIVGNDSSKITIEVLVPPKIIEFNNMTAVEGSMMQIICNAMGRPEPTVTVLYVGKDINESKFIDEDPITSPFMTVKPTSEGYYICNATNNVAYETSIMYLSVLHKPIFEVAKETVWGWKGIGIPINLSCIYNANPEGTLTWSYIIENEIQPEKLERVRQLLDDLNKSWAQYIVMSLTNTTDLYGKFECVARNEYGETKKTIDFKQGFPPSVIPRIEGDWGSTEVIFHIQRPTNYQGPEVIGYFAEYDIDSNYNFTDIHPNRTWSMDRETEGFVLSDLIPDTTYIIRVAAINEVGIGVWNDLSTFKTLAPSVPSAPTWETSSVELNGTENQVLKWTEPIDNGATIDYYLIRYCTDCKIDNESCKEMRVMTTEFQTDLLKDNTTYCVEVRARNSVGVSEAANVTVTVAARTMETTVSAGGIIGIAIVIVLIAFIVLDVLLCTWKRQGMIANFYYKKSKKRKHEVEQIRDKKGLLKENNASTAEDTKKHKEFEYNKSTGIITGKHSSV